MRGLTKLLLIALVGVSVPFTRATYHSKMAGEEYDPKTDLASLLQNPPIKQHQRLSEALQIIHPIQTGPRCHYHAALNLLNDCKFLETASTDSKNDAEANLDQVETVYAARLAVCELQSAYAEIPTDCKVVMASREACIKKRGPWFSRQENPKDNRLCYPEEPDPNKFNRCMKALFSINQSWMSYSNARQNAVVMCHASRDVIEKEKNLEHYKNLGEAVSHMAAILTDYNEKIKVWLNEHDAVVEKIRTSSERALEDVQEGLSTLESIKGGFRNLKGMMAHMAESFSREVEQSLDNTRNEMEQHREEIKQHHHNMAELNVQYASAQRMQMQENHDAAVAAVQSYQNTALGSLQAMHNAATIQANEFANKMDSLHVQLEASSTQISHINQVLEGVNKTVNRVNAATENLPDLLQTMTSLASALGNAIIYLNYWFIALVCLIALWKVNGKLAKYLAAIGGIAWYLYLVDLQSYAKALKDAVISTVGPVLKSPNPVILLLLGFVLVCLLSYFILQRTRLMYLYDYVDDKGQSFILPRVETPGRQESPPIHKGVPIDEV